MKKLISALVLAALLLVGCDVSFPPNEDTSSPEKPGASGEGEVQNPPYSPPTLVVPQYRDYGRETVDFSQITYERPDIDAAISAFSSLSDKIRKNAESFENQLVAIRDTDDIFFEISSMYTYANIMTQKNSEDAYWNGEFSYISVNYPRFAKAVEDLFVVCAQSAHKESFENEYFGAGTLSEYVDGGKYSEDAVNLMSCEAELEANYSKITSASITISYGGETGSADFLISYYYEKYGKNKATEAMYLYHAFMINSLYREEYGKTAKPIFIELIKTRSLIADSLEYESYAEYAYESLGHDYTAESMSRLLSDVSEYLMPLYYKLYTEIFKDYNAPNPCTELHKNEILNTLYVLLSGTDDELFEAFCYMLQHGLYDIEPANTARYEGAFTAYIDKYNSPYIFVSTKGEVSDYFTVIHEFGHFFDAYVNYGKDTSLDLSEISSQALEMLLLDRLEKELADEYENYLFIHQIDDALGTIRSQSFYAMAEHEIYKLDYEKITEENINAILKYCEEKFYYPEGTFTLNELVSVPHIVLYPYYVQSYTTSALVSLELYFAEKEELGAGLSAYKALVEKDNDASFAKKIEQVGLASPFEIGFVKNTVNRIHRHIYGIDYYKDVTLPDAA